MNIVKATRKFEEWLGRHTTIIKPDLQYKHEQMSKFAFPFLRATFYRWAQVFPEVCGEIAESPPVLAVGDLHIENFGTWRDAEGRLVWGVNDFDEAIELPYTNDLVRLATSALLAVKEGKLRLNGQAACDAILEGYIGSLRDGGGPFVLEEKHGWLRDLALGRLRDPVVFWEKMDLLPTAQGEIPLSARDALGYCLPEPDSSYRIARRRSGLGSLGRVRLVALAEHRGAKVAREVKALFISSVFWLQDSDRPHEIMCQVIANQAVRCHDPFYQIRDRWIVRRLSPHCSRISLSDLPSDRNELRLLHAMGWETANIHLGSKLAIKQIRAHLKKLPSKWLVSAAKKMEKTVLDDWKVWKQEIKS